MARARYCHECQTCLITLGSESLCVRCKERHRIPRTARVTDRCSMCKRIRPILDFTLDRNNVRAYTCFVCHERRRDSYRERTGEPISKEGRVRRFKQAQRIVEKALRARIRGERLKGHWLKAREQWERGELDYEEGFEEGVYRVGPYRQWVGYTDPREESIREEERAADREESWEGEGEEGRDRERFADREESWEGFTGERESFTSLQESWEGSTDREESFTSLQETRESSLSPQESPQAQYCSSCNQKKPLIDFGRFFTCNTCRERNKRANRTRHIKQKVNYLNKSS
jgi:hypothetical protein